MESNQDKKTEDELRERESEATSDETVEDLENTLKKFPSGSNDSDGPSPDGTTDEPDELKDAGPM